MQFWDYVEKLPVFWSVQARRLSERAVDTRNCLFNEISNICEV
jgi:hypothetical protein